MAQAGNETRSGCARGLRACEEGAESKGGSGRGIRGADQAGHLGSGGGLNFNLRGKANNSNRAVKIEDSKPDMIQKYFLEIFSC